MSAEVRRAKLDKRIFKLAREFLLSFKEITPEILDKQLHYTQYKKPRNMKDIYHRLVDSSRNRNMMPKVIESAIGKIDNLEPILEEFDPNKVFEKYGLDWEPLFNDVQQNICGREIEGKLFPQFCKSILSGAKFLIQFESVDDFYNFIDFFDSDDRARPTLPMMIDKEITGFGFTLACDFLKEIGYENFAKPDVHLKQIFSALSLSETDDEYDVFKAIVRVADNVGEKPYLVDKMFWLVGSGRFYCFDINIGQHRDEFIEYAFKKLYGETESK